MKGKRSRNKREDAKLERRGGKNAEGVEEGEFFSLCTFSPFFSSLYLFILHPLVLFFHYFFNLFIPCSHSYTSAFIFQIIFTFFYSVPYFVTFLFLNFLPPSHFLILPISFTPPSTLSG